METWLREARHVGRLSHPHIATLFEADENVDAKNIKFKVDVPSVLRTASLPSPSSSVTVSAILSTL